MIFLLATLPKSQYNILLDTFKTYEEGTLVKLNKIDSHKQFDCKGSITLEDFKTLMQKAL